MPVPVNPPSESFNFNKQCHITYVQDGDAYRPIQASDYSSNGSNSSSATSFGEVSIAVNTPFIQSAPIYNYLPPNFRAFTSNNGSAGVVEKQFSVSSGTTIFGYGAIQSFRSLNYKAGQGGMIRISALFPDGGIASCWQGAGLLNIGDELSFGYNGINFGIWHRYNGKAEIRNLTLSVGSSGAETATIQLDGVSYNVPITSGSVQKNANEIETWAASNITGWTAWQKNDTVVFVATSDGAKTGTFSYSSNGDSAGSFSTITSGITKTSDFIEQSNWNINTKTDLDPTKGNVYQINYQYLGYGNLTFSIEDQTTGIIIPVHRIRYPNTSITPSLGNPSLHVGLYAASIGSTTNVTVKSGSMAAFVQGDTRPTRNPRATSNVKTVVTTTPTNILTIRNKRQVNGEVNQVEIQPILLSVFTESNKGATIDIYGNPTVDGNSNFQEVGNTNLVSEVDVAGTTLTTGNGRLLASFVVPGNSSVVINLNDLRIRVPPTLRLVIAGKVNSGNSDTIGASLTWYEDT